MIARFLRFRSFYCCLVDRNSVKVHELQNSQETTDNILSYNIESMEQISSVSNYVLSIFYLYF
jgi:hypothetical protein